MTLEVAAGAVLTLPSTRADVRDLGHCRMLVPAGTQLPSLAGTAGPTAQHHSTRIWPLSELTQRPRQVLATAGQRLAPRKAGLPSWALFCVGRGWDHSPGRTARGLLPAGHFSVKFLNTYGAFLCQARPWVTASVSERGGLGDP